MIYRMLIVSMASLIFIVFACSENPVNTNRKIEVKKMQIVLVKQDSVHAVQKTIAQAKAKDTLFKIGKFLIFAKAGMRIDFIQRGQPIPHLISSGDTLYHDNQYTILGDGEEIRDGGVYKRFKARHTFSMYEVDSIYKGKLAAPNFNTNLGAKAFITRIKRGCKESRINFAGHYTIVEWGCGMCCGSMAIIDRIDGHIYSSDSIDGYCGLSYKLNSRLIELNNLSVRDFPGYIATADYVFYHKPDYFEFENGIFKKLK